MLEAFSLLVRQVGELHRLDDPGDDHCRAKAGTEAKKQHAATAITSERLHCGIVDNFNRPAKRLVKVEAHPALPEIVRLRDGPIAGDWARISNRYRIVGPISGHIFHCGDHRVGAQFRARSELTPRRIWAQLHLDVCSSDINHKNVAVFPL